MRIGVWSTPAYLRWDFEGVVAEESLSNHKTAFGFQRRIKKCVHDRRPMLWQTEEVAR